jgi:D-glycero-D-manno-heptose 1,7-bisphosphate phosphatase
VRPTVEHVILDRDGVLNRELESGWLSSIDQWEWEEGSLEALGQFAITGMKISIVSNQSGIGRGVVSEQAVREVHQWLTTLLAATGVELVGIFVCPHAPDEGCDCRKPRPGLVEAAIEQGGVAPARCLLIGDDLRDLDAGRAAGLRVALVCTGKGARHRDAVDSGTLVFENLLAACNAILGSDEGAIGVSRSL